MCLDELLDLLHENPTENDVKIMLSGQELDIKGVWSDGETTYIEAE